MHFHFHTAHGSTIRERRRRFGVVGVFRKNNSPCNCVQLQSRRYCGRIDPVGTDYDCYQIGFFFCLLLLLLSVFVSVCFTYASNRIIRIFISPNNKNPFSKCTHPDVWGMDNYRDHTTRTNRTDKQTVSRGPKTDKNLLVIFVVVVVVVVVRQYTFYMLYAYLQKNGVEESKAGISRLFRLIV